MGFRKLTKEEIKLIFEKSESVSDFCRKSGVKGVSGNTIKEARNLLNSLGLRFINSREKYLQSPKKCKHCGDTLSYEKRNNTFCNSSCSASFNNLGREISEEHRKKVSNTLKKTLKSGKIKKVKKEKPTKKCLVCSKKINIKNKTGLCQHCLRYSDYGKSIASKKAKKLMEEGKIKSWTSRNTLSYPEKFWLKVLKNNNIAIDKPNKYFKPYFLDFWINKDETKIDLEIDGRQHSLKERRKSDKIRDAYLIENGFVIYRVKWNEINSENGKKKMKEKINKFLEFYRDI